VVAVLFIALSSRWSKTCSTWTRALTRIVDDWRHPFMDDSTHEDAAQNHDDLELGWAPLLLARVWADVNGRIWDSSKSD